MRPVPDEARLLARMATFGIVVGGAYWLLTYEDAGTVLLLAFGLASGLGALAVFLGWPRPAPAADRTSTGRAASAPAASALEAAGEAFPAPGWAPLGIALGVGGVALGAAFGPWLVITGVLVTITAGSSWLSAAMREAPTAAPEAGAGQNAAPAADRAPADHDGGTEA